MSTFLSKGGFGNLGPGSRLQSSGSFGVLGMRSGLGAQDERLENAKLYLEVHG